MLAHVALLAFLIGLPDKAEDDMAKSSKPDFLTEERLLACLMFLSKARKSGVTNIFEIRLKLRHAFPDLTTKQAAEVVAYWLRTFTVRAHKEAS